MNAQAVMKADAVRKSEAAKQPAPAASLAGMRLWKEPAQGESVKQDCLATRPETQETAPEVSALLGYETVDPITVPLALKPVPDVHADASEDLATPVIAEPEIAAEELVITEGGLPPHVSSYPQRARDERRKDSDILGYWARIRGEREMPAWTDLDQNQIAYFWPNSFLLSCISRNDRGTPMISRATRIVDNDGLADRSADLEFTPPMVSWIMRLSFDVASMAMPLIDTHVFRNEEGERMTCELVALPLSQSDDRVDHVLCHVKPKDEQS